MSEAALKLLSFGAMLSKLLNNFSSQQHRLELS
jgi:hypothetical protein